MTLDRKGINPMELLYKPDFEEAAERWETFWRHEMLDRPVVVINAPREGAEPATRPTYLMGLEGRYQEAVEMWDRVFAAQVCLGEAMPYGRAAFGPDQYAAFFGAQLKHSPDSPDTTWVEPFVEDWDDVLPLEFDPANATWQALLEYERLLAEAAKGRFLVGQIDLHSNMDTLFALRGSERMCMDLIECPETVDQAMAGARASYPVICDALYEAGVDNGGLGSVGWTPAFTRGRFAVTQCDFICMMSPAMARRFVLPAIAEEAAYLDHTVYHLDGPDALPHLDDICAIEDIDVVQWVQGAGNGEHVDWIDLLKEIQRKGKSLEVRGTVDELKVLHKELDPARAYYYCSSVASVKEGEELLEWFRRNT